jgi:hypothetical protein
MSQYKVENGHDTPQSHYKRWIVKLRLTEVLKRSFYMKNQAEALDMV